MSRAVDLLASKLPKPRTPLGQRVREILPIGAHVPLHAALTYLFAICLFSITFLVFLNSVLSFVVTDLFDIHDGVGSIVGTLGFVDELVAVFMVILWGGLSDRIGTRLIAASGYFLVGLAFIAIVHVRTVYPGLLLARVLFSMGASATVVSVTAVLPEISTLSPNLTATPKPGQHQNTPADPPERPSLSKSTPQGNQASSSSRSDIAGPSSSTSTTSTLAPPSDPSRPAKWRPPSRSRSRQQQKEQSKQIPKPITGTLSGLVGLMTGCGALIALVFFLPLPAKLSKDKHMTQTEALRHTFYAVAVASWAVALAVFIGLRGQGVGGKTWEFWKPNQFALFARLRGEGDDHDASGRSRPTCDVEAISEPGPTNHEHPSSPDERSALLQASSTQSSTEGMSSRPNRHHYDTVGPSAITTEHYGGHPWTKVVRAYFQGLWLAFKAGGEDWRIGLGYLGGFVARSMSVGISLFIPLYVNQWMRARGMCPPVLPTDPNYSKSCHSAYILAAMLTGTSQLFALIFAPIVGYFSDRYGPQYPLIATAVLGFISCAAFSALQSLAVGADRSWAYLHCALMGIGEIGAIVSSLALIGSAIQEPYQQPSPQEEIATAETPNGSRETAVEPGLPSSYQLPSPPANRLAFKGSISGVYSLCGAAGILILTQFGGWGADHINSGFAFDLLAVFFSIEIALGCWLIFKATGIPNSTL